MKRSGTSKTVMLLDTGDKGLIMRRYQEDKRKRKTEQDMENIVQMLHGEKHTINDSGTYGEIMLVEEIHYERKHYEWTQEQDHKVTR